MGDWYEVKGHCWFLAAGLAFVILAAAQTSGFIQDGQRLQGAIYWSGIQRPIEARLSLKLGYGVCAPPESVAKDLIDDPTCPGLRKTPGGNVATLMQAVRRRIRIGFGKPKISSLHAIGVTALIGNEHPRRMDDAIAHLSAASSQTPDQWEILNDLAAAYFVRAQRGDNPEDLFRALVHLEHAIALDSNSEVALFNLALVQTRLFLNSAARKTWRRFLAVSEDSDWYQEGQKNLDALIRLTRHVDPDFVHEFETAVEKGEADKALALYRASPQGIREHILDVLFPAWAKAMHQGDLSVAEDRARLLFQIGELITSETETRFINDLIKDIYLSRKQYSTLNTLAKAHLAFRRGMDLRLAGEIELAMHALEEATILAKEAGSPLAWSARFYHTLCVGRTDFFLASQQLESLMATPKLGQYPNLKMRALWSYALWQGLSGQASEALAAYQAALLLAQELEDGESEAFLYSLVASRLFDMGDFKAAWENYYLALRHRQKVRSPHRKGEILAQVADAAADQEHWAAALAFKEEELDIALKLAEPRALINVFSRRSHILQAAGRLDEALVHLAEARQWLAEISHLGTRLDHQAMVDLAEGRARANDLFYALPLLNRAIGHLESRDHQFLLIDAYLDRARVLTSAGRLDAAKLDLERTLEEVERQRAEISGHKSRRQFLDRWDRAFEEVIHFYLDDFNDPILAFETAERSRVRNLLDLLDAAGRGYSAQLNLGEKTTALGYEELMDTLPHGVILIQFGVLADRVVTWILKREAPLQKVEWEIASELLEDKVYRLRKALKGGSELRGQAMSEYLYDNLLRPVLETLDQDHTLVIVPDGALHGLPFAALQDRITGRYLLENQGHVVALSAAAFVQAQKKRVVLTQKTLERALVVAVPEAPGFPLLPEVLAGGRDIAALFPAPRLLAGNQATLSGFLDGAKNADVIHISSHAHSRPSRTGEEPFLALSPNLEKQNDGRLGVEEILSGSYPNVSLVVLGACSTAAGEVSSSEGPLSLARAFLGSGIPTVVSALWDVEDSETRWFLKYFHQKLTNGESPAEALRLTQLQALEKSHQGQKSAPEWAAFQVFGAS